MKDWIVLIAGIVLGMVLYLFIAGDNNSLKSESQTIMSGVRTSLEQIQP